MTYYLAQISLNLVASDAIALREALGVRDNAKAVAALPASTRFLIY